MSISQSDIIISPTVVPILVLISPWIPALSSWSFLLCLSCLWRLWSDHSREDASPHRPSRQRWYLHPYRCWRILSWKPREMNVVSCWQWLMLLFFSETGVQSRAGIWVYLYDICERWVPWRLKEVLTQNDTCFSPDKKGPLLRLQHLHREIFFMSSCDSCQRN